MNIQKMKTIKKIALVILIMMMSTLNSYPYWSMNKTEIAFGGTMEKGISIEYYIVQGAINFLDAHAYTMQYLGKTEALVIEGGSTLELKVLLDKASISMRQANEYYRKLYTTAASTALNMVMINALRTFDYNGFIKTNREYINLEIFDEVKSYLALGNILGIYNDMVSKTDQLLILLTRLTQATDSGIAISLTDTWKLNHLLASTMLYGQYTAQVFKTISKTELPLQDN